VDAIIRAFNRHHAQRRLRDLLLDHHETLELDLARVPHAFDGDRVLDLAGRCFAAAGPSLSRSGSI
jgi:hypothetical protein